MFHYVPAVLGIFFAALFVALAFTAVSVMKAEARCDTTRGTFSIEGGTAWCRY